MTSLSLSLPNSADISAAALENDILTSGQDGSDAPTMRVESEDGSEKDDDDDEEPGGETSVTPLADTQKTKKRRRKYPPIKIDLDQCKYSVLRHAAKAMGWKVVSAQVREPFFRLFLPRARKVLLATAPQPQPQPQPSPCTHIGDQRLGPLLGGWRHWPGARDETPHPPAPEPLLRHARDLS